MILETCLAICINSFFMWPEQDWNLGEWVHGFVSKQTESFDIRPYGNYSQNISVIITKTKTRDGCAKVMIKIDPLKAGKSTGSIKPLILIINKVCPGKNA